MIYIFIQNTKVANDDYEWMGRISSCIRFRDWIFFILI